jgi:hypothetical protein
VKQRQGQRTNCRHRERCKSRKSPRPATDETAYAATTPVPGIEDRAQHGIGEKAKVVSFIDQQSGAGPAVEVMVDRRWGYVVGAIRLSDQAQHGVQRAHPLADFGRRQCHRPPPTQPEGDSPTRVRERPDAAASDTLADQQF